MNNYILIYPGATQPTNEEGAKFFKNTENGSAH